MHFNFDSIRDPFVDSEDDKDLEDDTEDLKILKAITLKPPRNAFTQYFLSEVESFKIKNKDEKIDLREFNTTCLSKWKVMEDKEKKSYN